MRKLYRGIEPIIAVVILVAVTLVIAIGVVGWIMGWWGTFGATESIRIYPDSYITVGTPNQLVLHLKNEGSATAVIYKIELTGGLTVQQRNITVTPGGEITETLTVTGGTPIAGTRYQVSIYTRAGNVISATVQAR